MLVNLDILAIFILIGGMYKEQGVPSGRWEHVYRFWYRGDSLKIQKYSWYSRQIALSLRRTKFSNRICEGEKGVVSWKYGLQPH